MCVPALRSGFAIFAYTDAASRSSAAAIALATPEGSFSGTYAPIVVARSETANSWPRRSTMSPRLACSTTLERCSVAASAT